MGKEALIRYGSDSNANALLRSALAQVSGLRCYSCTEPKPFPDLQIDHLVPRSTLSTNSVAHAEASRLPVGVHVDDPENLAVICGRCNRLKSDKDFRNSLAFEMHQKEAAQRADQVRKIVATVRDGHKLASQLVSAAQADLADGEARALFIEFAPAVVQRLAGLDEASVDFVTVETALRAERGLPLDVRLVLDNRLRFVRGLASTLWSVDLFDIVREAAEYVVSALTDRAGLAIDDHGEQPVSARLDVSPPDVMDLELTFSSAEVQRHDGKMNFVLKGEADGWLTAHVVGYDPRALSGYRDSLTDVWVFGQFELWFAHPLDQPLEPHGLNFGANLDAVACDVDWSS
ncbi:HNH endonuclease [Microbacterium sp. NPDC058062]|uniref:HNH endonuclease n=1 Tax=Microbacterium sp. NPDC058062 TaxID=3346320 RepID=UPI0036DB3C6D